MTRSSASSTIAVLITTPGETPMPFLISMFSKVRSQKSECRSISSFFILTSDFLLLVFSKLLIKQIAKFFHCCFGIRAFGFDSQHDAFFGGEADHLHDGFAVGVSRVVAGLDHFDI